MGIIFSTETETETRRPPVAVNTLAKKEKSMTVKNTWLELLNKYTAGSANIISRTVKNGTKYTLIMCGLYKVITSILYKFKQNNSDSNSNSSSSSSSSSRWSDHLPPEITEQILQRLCLNDHFRFRKVCWSWRYAVARVIKGKSCAPKPQLLPQLLMFKSRYPQPILNLNPNRYRYPYRYQYLGFNDHTLVNLFDGGRVSHSSHLELFGKYCMGSIEGWLILTDAFLRPHTFSDFYTANHDVSIMFFNPFSGAMRWLPTQLSITESAEIKTRSILFLRKVVASSAPDSPNCRVAAISRNGDLLICRPPFYTWHSLFTATDGQIISLLHCEIGIYDGKLYALCFDGEVYVFDLHSDINYQVRPVNSAQSWFLMPSSEVIDNWAQHNYRVLGSTISCFHLVTDTHANELLLVAQVAYDYTSPPKTKLFRVFRLDPSAPPQRRWLELETLGDRILFISHTSCKCISASSAMRTTTERMSYYLEEEEELLHNRVNCIFFAFDYDCTGWNFSSTSAREVGVFSLADGRIKRKDLHLPRSLATRPPVWFTPSL